jgi:hypothetical protein
MREHCIAPNMMFYLSPNHAKAPAKAHQNVLILLPKCTKTCLAKIGTAHQKSVYCAFTAFGTLSYSFSAFGTFCQPLSTIGTLFQLLAHFPNFWQTSLLHFKHTFAFF